MFMFDREEKPDLETMLGPMFNPMVIIVVFFVFGLVVFMIGFFNFFIAPRAESQTTATLITIAGIVCLATAFVLYRLLWLDARAAESNEYLAMIAGALVAPEASEAEDGTDAPDPNEWRRVLEPPLASEGTSDE